MNYWNEGELNKKAIEYLSIPKERRIIEGKKIRDEICLEMLKIIDGIIKTHKFYIWDNYDDLKMIAFEQCIKALEKYNPSYTTTKGENATLFNYISLTAKKALLYHTLSQRKNRGNISLDCVNISTNNSYEDRTSAAIEYVSKKVKELKCHREIPKLLSLYIEATKGFNKKDFFIFAKAFGYHPRAVCLCWNQIINQRIEGEQENIFMENDKIEEIS